MPIGIDAIAFDIPKIYLPIAELALARNIAPPKLEKGLGLINMAVPDTYQDAVVFAANAVLKLIKNNSISPNQVGRIYVGTESGVDAAKPIASYILSLLEETLTEEFGEHSLSHCDAVDMTFACIGGVDALQNTVDWIKCNPGEKGIVVCTDIAKYDLKSTGEYTQGAGAVAMLISEAPSIISIDSPAGVSTRGVFDFFKPRRTVAKSEIIQGDNSEWMGVLEAEVELFKEQPVFDGQYSNQCYVDRVNAAYYHLKGKLGVEGSLYNRWEGIIMHLPYAYQGRRMFTGLYIDDNPELSQELATTKGEPGDFVKTISKSKEYLSFVENKLAPAEVASSQIGNMYTASIFMGLLSFLSIHAEKESDIAGKRLGFIGYGSGSKAKVFEGTIQPNWMAHIKGAALFNNLEERTSINIDQYHQLHKRELPLPVLAPVDEYMLDSIEKDNPVLMGARYYQRVEVQQFQNTEPSVQG